jgi:hypothetical protein
MGYEVALLLVSHPASQPASQPPTLRSGISQQPLVGSYPNLKQKPKALTIVSNEDDLQVQWKTTLKY